MVSSRARRAETMASSDMAKKPFRTNSTSTITMEEHSPPLRPRPFLMLGEDGAFVHPGNGGGPGGGGKGA